MHIRGGLRLKFILLISAVLLVIFALTAYFLVRNVRTSLNDNINQESKAFASLATKPIGDTYAIYKDSGSTRIDIEIDKFLDLDSNVSNITVVGLNGSALYSRDAKLSPKINAASAESFDATYKVNPRDEIVQVVQPYFDDSGQHGQAIVYDISTAGVEKDISRQELDIVIFAILGLVLSALATYEFINIFFLRPIQQVSEMSGVIAAGYYSQQIVLDRKDEIGALASSVNRMADSLKTDIAKLQETDKLKDEFIMITSHNLRTPLTIIEGNVSLLNSKSVDPDIRKMVTGIEQSARRLNVFSEQMLTIASIEGGERIGNFEPVMLADLLAPLKEEFLPISAEKKIVFNVAIAHGDATVQCNRSLVIGALRNLLDNAFKFTPVGGNVSLNADVTHDKAAITITDSGIGIKAVELPKLFTKFHRGTDTLQYNYEGTGIGLYVTKLIIEQHHGAVTATSQEGHGATFTVELPLQSSAPKTV
ncbi:MAG TPA: HAMP domain-containing sensor histidine kinase [Patescibacteria group bacterium]|nr:HAMP domain-containing sensor histidine kinase [Patescibacteria group bacterium]